MRDVLRPLSRAWMGVIKKAHEVKRKQFGDDADEIRRFHDGPYDWLYSSQYGTKPSSFQLGTDSVRSPSFRMTSNKVADVVQLYGPALYARNPHRTVTRKELSAYPYDRLIEQIQDPQMAEQVLQQATRQIEGKQRTTDIKAGLMEDLLNATPNELDLQWHSRQAIDDALITGLGLVWIETYKPPGSDMLFVGSFYDSVDNLLIDPDMETWRNAWWIARRCFAPVWKVEKDYGLKPGTIRGTMESSKMQGSVESSPEYDYFRKRGDTNDIVVYWKIYSRMGMGHRMTSRLSQEVKANHDYLEKFGEHVYLVVCEEFDEFLNLNTTHTKSMNLEKSAEQVQWPTPFWKDPTDPWPCSRYLFHERQRIPWPISHVKPALGELKYMNWVLSFLADKVKNTTRDFVAIMKSASEELKTSVLSGGDLTLLEFEATQGAIANVIQFLQHPPFNKDILEVYSLLKQEWEQRTGLSMLMYGETKKQLRSATEAQYKTGQMMIRPDDMARQVEQSATMTARKEMGASYWHYSQQHVSRLIGPERAELYAEYIMRGMTIDDVFQELDVQIEAGSIRKPNKEREIANANEAIQAWQQISQAYFNMTGDVGPLNILAAEWSKANNAKQLQFQPPPPPKPDESAQQQAQMELQMSQQEHQQKLQQKQEEHQVKLKQLVDATTLKTQLDAMTAQQDMEIDQTAAEQQLLRTLQTQAQDMLQDEASHDQEMRQDEETHDQELEQSREMSQLQRRLNVIASNGRNE